MTISTPGHQRLFSTYTYRIYKPSHTHASNHVVSESFNDACHSCQKGTVALL